MRTLIITLSSIIIAGLILYALTQIELAPVWDVLTTSRYDLWAIAFILTLASLYTRAKRWHVLLDSKISLHRCFHVSNIAYMLNMLVPLRIGELARIVLMSRGTESAPMVTTLAGIVLERLIDLLILLFILGISLLFLPVAEFISLLSFVIGAIAILAVIVLILLANAPHIIYGILEWIETRLPFLGILKLQDKFKHFQAGLSVLQSWRQLGWILFWSMASWLLTFGMGYILMLAFFNDASWQTVLFFNAFASVAVATTAALSYVPSATGPYQASVVIALQAVGITEPVGAPLAFAIILHLVNFSAVILVGIIGMFAEGLSFMELFRLRKQSDSEQLSG